MLQLSTFVCLGVLLLTCSGALASFCGTQPWIQHPSLPLITTPDTQVDNAKYFAPQAAYWGTGRFVTMSSREDTPSGRPAAGLFVYDADPVTGIFNLTQTLIPSSQGVTLTSTMLENSELAIWGDTIVFGALYFDGSRGAAWVWRLNATSGVWDEIRFAHCLDYGGLYKFADSVVLNDQMILISNAYYTREYLQIWDPVTGLDLGNVTVDEYSGSPQSLQLALSGTTIACGYIRSTNGYVKIYEETCPGCMEWTETSVHTGVYSSPDYIYYYGSYMHFLNPDLLMIGWKHYYGAPSPTPRYHIVRRVGGIWDFDTPLLLPAPVSTLPTYHNYDFEYISGPISSNHNGSIIVVPAPQARVTQPHLEVEAGAVLVYEQVGNSFSWEATQILSMPTPLSHVNFGYGGTMLIGDVIYVLQIPISKSTNIYTNNAKDGHIWPMVQQCGCSNTTVCLNGGMCNPVGVDDFECDCPTTHFGERCEKDRYGATLCDSSPCAATEICVELLGDYDCRIDFQLAEPAEMACFTECGCAFPSVESFDADIKQHFWPSYLAQASSGDWVTPYVEFCSSAYARINPLSVSYFYSFGPNENSLKGTDTISTWPSYWNPVRKSHHESWVYDIYAPSQLISTYCTHYSTFDGAAFEEDLATLACPDEATRECARGCQCSATATYNASCYDFCSEGGAWDVATVKVRDDIIVRKAAVATYYGTHYDPQRKWKFVSSQTFQYPMIIPMGSFSSVCVGPGSWNSMVPSSTCSSMADWISWYPMSSYMSVDYYQAIFSSSGAFSITERGVSLVTSYMSDNTVLELLSPLSQLYDIDIVHKYTSADQNVENCMVGCAARAVCPLLFCRDTVCLNDGICREDNGGFCDCADGFEGDVCEVSLSVVLACDVGHECQNGTCISIDTDSYTCDCTADYTGVLCDVSLLVPSSSSPSSASSSSSSSSSSVSSTPTQASLSSSSSSTVVELDLCGSNPCGNGTCVLSDSGEMECVCPEGTSGVFCELHLDVCSTTPCANGGTCSLIVEEGTSVEFECVCAPQWTGLDCGTETTSLNYTYVVAVEDIVDMDLYLQEMTFLFKNASGTDSVYLSHITDGDVYIIEINIYVDSTEEAEAIATTVATDASLQTIITNQPPDTADDTVDTGTDETAVLMLAVIVGGSVFLILGLGALLVYNRKANAKKLFNSESNVTYTMPL